MYSDEFVSKVILKLNSSKFDNSLLNEISKCSMLMSLYKDSGRTIENDKYSILLNDMILSLLRMQRNHENIVYTNPFEVFNFSWIYKNVKNETDVEKRFCNRFDQLIHSNFILSNELPLELKSLVICNVYSTNYLKKNFKTLYDYMIKTTSEIEQKYLFMPSNMLRNLFIYNNNFLSFSNKTEYEKVGLYFLLRKDYLSLIILALRLNDDYLVDLVRYIDDENLSISELFGKGLVIQSNEKE